MNVLPGNSTFQAKRTYTSGELLAIRRQQAERVQLPLKSSNLQDSSELTARVRKYASVLPGQLPSYGNSTNMVKWRDSSVVQAMKEGQSYRASAANAEPIKYPLTCDGVVNEFTRNDIAFSTQPKRITCCPENPGDIRVIQPFNLKEHFGMANSIKNTKLYVPNPQSTCRSCDIIEK